MRFVHERPVDRAREDEAFAEEEAGDAVRLLDDPRGKGLEFRVVVVADAGRDRPPRGGEEIIAGRTGSSASRCSTRPPAKRHGAFDYEARASGRAGGRRGERLSSLLRRDDARGRPPARSPARSTLRARRRHGHPWAGCSSGSAPSRSTLSVRRPPSSSTGRRGWHFGSTANRPEPDAAPVQAEEPVEEQLSLFTVLEEAAAPAAVVEPPGASSRWQSPPIFEPRRLVL